MFSIELEHISVAANPKGGNQALSITIRGRYILDVFLTCNEIRFSYEMVCFPLNSSLSPLCRTRRGEIERSLSESGVDTFVMFSSHMSKNVVLLK